MTNLALKRRAIRLYRNPMVPKTTQRHNQAMYLRALAILGDRYVLRQPAQRLFK